MSRVYGKAEFAKRVLRHLGTEHTELYVSAADALSLLQSYLRFTVNLLRTARKSLLF